MIPNKIIEAKNSASTQRSLDHFVNVASDLEVCGAMYRRLGFQVMPVMEHVSIGTSNICIQFEDTYLELIGDIAKCREAQLTDTMERWTRFGENIFWKTALTSQKLEDDKFVLDEAGLDTQDILSAARRVRKIGGGWDVTDSRSMYIFLEPHITGSFFISDHRKPEAIWMPDYQVHLNGAIRIAGISYIARSVTEDLDYHSTMFGGAPAEQDSDRAVFHTPRGEFLEIVTPEKAATWLPDADPLQEGLAIRGAAYTIEVDSLRQCRLALRTSGVPHKEIDGAVVTPAAFGCGMAMHFVERP